MIHVVYVTPIGWICSCGSSQHTLTGTSAARFADDHISRTFVSKDENLLIDYRRCRRPDQTPTIPLDKEG